MAAWIVMLTLAGCAAMPTTITRIKLMHSSIPARILVSDPLPPVPPIKGQASVSRDIVALWQNDVQCHKHPGAVRTTLGKFAATR